MATKIKKLSKRPRKINLIVYAHPGDGKTMLAGSSTQEGAETLLLNADGPDGPESIRAHFPRSRMPDVWDIDDYSDLDLVLKRARRGDLDKYHWIWLDSVTLFQERGMDQIMAEAVREKPHRDPDVPDVREYLKNQNHLSRWIRHMKVQSFNFGITAHVMNFEDEEEGTITYMPAIQGGGKIPMAQKVCAHMSIVGRLYVVTRKKGGKQKATRVLQTARRGQWYAKDRFGRLGTRVVDPSIPKIEEIVWKKKTKKED